MKRAARRLDHNGRGARQPAGGRRHSSPRCRRRLQYTSQDLSGNQEPDACRPRNRRPGARTGMDRGDDEPGFQETSPRFLAGRMGCPAKPGYDGVGVGLEVESDWTLLPQAASAARSGVISASEYRLRDNTLPTKPSMNFLSAYTPKPRHSPVQPGTP